MNSLQTNALKKEKTKNKTIQFNPVKCSPVALDEQGGKPGAGDLMAETPSFPEI